jgi:SEC-C motif-containing protein
MRSRYTAYAQRAIDYVVETHDPRTRDQVDREGAEAWAKQSSWLGLEIRETVAGAAGDSAGEVEFVARYRIEDKEFAHHERSRFTHSEGRWYYVDGDMIKPKPVVRETPKVGRNEPCTCGSGKKFKKCCGA